MEKKCFNELICLPIMLLPDCCVFYPIFIFSDPVRTKLIFLCLGSGAYTTSGEGEGDLPVLGSAPPPDPWMQGAYRTGTMSTRGIYYAKC